MAWEYSFLSSLPVGQTTSQTNKTLHTQSTSFWVTAKNPISKILISYTKIDIRTKKQDVVKGLLPSAYTLSSVGIRGGNFTTTKKHKGKFWYCHGQ